MRQDYENFETIILDDSSKSEYLKRIDDFAERPGVTVVRRSDRAGFKAGNLNHYLQGRTDYDYFVVLDSDEVIPENYIKEVLKYYAYSPRSGRGSSRASGFGRGKRLSEPDGALCAEQRSDLSGNEKFLRQQRFDRSRHDNQPLPVTKRRTVFPPWWRRIFPSRWT